MLISVDVGFTGGIAVISETDNSQSYLLDMPSYKLPTGKLHKVTETPIMRSHYDIQAVGRNSKRS